MSQPLPGYRPSAYNVLAISHNPPYPRLGRARPQDSIYLYQCTARISLAVIVSCPSCVLHVLSLFIFLSCPVLFRFSGGSLDRPHFKLQGEEEMREKRSTR
ncbi:hypothetical protein QR685DRAFT_569281 [Neurospora intermedia]|uniref:Uncharacterized protein n=1 Tax=Neurospora intermedia TaxID=5142 RepID=A0ABR3DMY2_NEUIN